MEENNNKEVKKQKTGLKVYHLLILLVLIIIFLCIELYAKSNGYKNAIGLLTGKKEETSQAQNENKTEKNENKEEETGKIEYDGTYKRVNKEISDEYIVSDNCNYIVIEEDNIYFSANLTNKMLEGTFTVNSKNEIEYRVLKDTQDYAFYTAATYRFETINGKLNIVIDNGDIGIMYYEKLDEEADENNISSNNSNNSFSVGKYTIEGMSLEPGDNYGIENLELKETNEFLANMPLGTSYVGLYTVENNKINCKITGARETEGTGETLNSANGELVFSISDSKTIVFESASSDLFKLTIGKTYKLENSANASVDNSNYSELTSPLNGEDVLCVTKAEDNNDGTFTLYGVVYKGHPNAVEAQISTQWSKTNEYKKITLPYNTLCISAYPEEENTTVSDYFRKYEEVEPENTTNPTDITTYTFEFENGKCTKVIDYCTSN